MQYLPPSAAARHRVDPHEARLQLEGCPGARRAQAKLDKTQRGQTRLATSQLCAGGFRSPRNPPICPRLHHLRDIILPPRRWVGSEGFANSRDPEGILTILLAYSLMDEAELRFDPLLLNQVAVIITTRVLVFPCRTAKKKRLELHPTPPPSTVRSLPVGGRYTGMREKQVAALGTWL